MNELNARDEKLHVSTRGSSKTVQVPEKPPPQAIGTMAPRNYDENFEESHSVDQKKQAHNEADEQATTDSAGLTAKQEEEMNELNARDEKKHVEDRAQAIAVKQHLKAKAKQHLTPSQQQEYRNLNAGELTPEQKKEYDRMNNQSRADSDDEHNADHKHSDGDAVEAMDVDGAHSSSKHVDSAGLTKEQEKEAEELNTKEIVSETRAQAVAEKKQAHTEADEQATADSAGLTAKQEKEMNELNARDEKKHVEDRAQAIAVKQHLKAKAKQHLTPSQQQEYRNLNAGELTPEQKKEYDRMNNQSRADSDDEHNADHKHSDGDAVEAMDV